MLVEEAHWLRRILADVKQQKIINLCSQSLQDTLKWQPYYYDEIIKPLHDRKNELVNLDFRAGMGVDVVANVEEIKEIEDGTFDLALFTNSIEHLWHPEKAIDEIYRILKPDGILWASAPTASYPYHEDPIDTMLRMSSLEDWRMYLWPGLWEIFSFRIIESYRRAYARVDTVSVIGARKVERASNSNQVLYTAEVSIGDSEITGEE